MKQCYQSGCFFNMPCNNQNCCNNFYPERCFPPRETIQSPFGCGNINIAIPIGLLIFAGGYLLGQKCDFDNKNCH